jgi:hypothetical protein
VDDNYNVIGDLAGNLETTKALMAKMPQDAKFLFLGDINDRGPLSNQLIQFLIDNGHQSTNSNHGHMMVDYYKSKTDPKHTSYYERDLFLYNGGDKTMDSYNENWRNMDIKDVIPKAHIDFLENLPLYIKTDKYLFSHAPLIQNKTLEQACDLGYGFNGRGYHKAEGSIIWNRLVPWGPHKDLGGRINIFGHNSLDKVKIYSPKFPQSLKVDTAEDFRNEMFDTDPENKVYAICIDTCRAKKLTGIHLPTMTIYQQDYIDFKPTGMY